MRNFLLIAVFTAFTSGLTSPAAHAWLVKDHQILTRVAVKSLPKDVPLFFRNASEAIGTIAGDPDIHKNKTAPVLLERVYPEHFIDSEYLKGKPRPEKYFDFLKLLYAAGEDPSKVGSLPYAILEWSERLAVTFAELRRKPTDKILQMKAQVYAGYLAHYAGDMCQPLHTTIHYDGRSNDKGESPHSGIHFKVDALPHQIPGLKPIVIQVDAADKITVTTLRERMEETFNSSHALVDRVYALESKFKDPPKKATNKSPPLDPEVLNFGRERADATIRFTAELFTIAWRRSEKIVIPAWVYE